jgi:hypothetical protein
MDTVESQGLHNEGSCVLHFRLSECQRSLLFNGSEISYCHLVI